MPTVGQIMVNEVLPADMRDYSRVLDKKGLSDLLSEVGRKHPDKFKDISFKLGQIGWEAAFTTGGNSFGLKDMQRSKSSRKRRKALQRQIDAILDNDRLEEGQRNEDLIKLVAGQMDADRDEIYDESVAENNPLSQQLRGAGRGNKMNLRSLRGSDWLYNDHRGNVIPVPVTRSYSQGLSPLEYWAGTYGARTGVLATKFATQDAGFFGKQLQQVSHRQVVTGVDRDGDPDTLVGFPVDIEDMDSEGALLSHPVAGYKRNTILTPKILRDIKRRGNKRILIRSPAVSGSPEGGLYARDVGVREFGTLAATGEQVGLTASQSISEPISQGQLCLAAGTLVRMADWTVRPIEEITAGERVMGSDKSGRLFPTEVVNTYDNGEKDCVHTRFREAKTKQYVDLVSTSDHKLLAKISEIIPISDCKGAMLAKYNPTLPEDNSAEYFHRQAQTEVGPRSTYDIEVEHPDHLFVLANGLIVSNSAKHSGGVVGAARVLSGFDYLNQLVQVPKTFKGSAAHATVDGSVQLIEEAPAGGNYVTINNEKHYVGAGYAVQVKKGDKVEAGDVISEGTPNPALVTKYKGVGEGRRYFIKAFTQAMRDSGMTSHRRNVELLSKGLINHVRLDDEMGDFAPNDVVPYSSLEHAYVPREGHKQVQPRAAVGQYLEKPYLHYTIGTQVKPTMLQDLSDFGVKQIAVHRDPPPFQAEMIRGMGNLQHDPDWQTRMFGSGLKGSLLKGVHRGGTSDREGTSFVAGRAQAADFGQVGLVKSPDRKLDY